MQIISATGLIHLPPLAPANQILKNASPHAAVARVRYLRRESLDSRNTAEEGIKDRLRRIDMVG